MILWGLTRAAGFLVVFVLAVFLAMAVRGWLAGAEADPMTPTPVIAPVATGEEQPEEVGSGPVRAASTVAHAGGGIGAAGGPMTAAIPEPGGSVPLFGFEDPCAGPEPPGDCPDGEPATVLGEDEPAPLALDVVPYPYGTEDVACVPQGSESAWMPVLIVANNPAELQVDYGPSFSEGSLELSTDEAGHACATLDDLVEEAPEVVVRVNGTDADGSEAFVERRLKWSPSGRPPVVLKATDDLSVEAVVPQRDPAGGHAVRVRLGADCDPADTDGTDAEEVHALPAAVLEADGYPYDPDYSHQALFRLVLAEGTDHLACVLWLDDGGALVELEEHPLTAPDRLNVRISLGEIHGSPGELGAVEVEVPGCGATTAPGVVCDSDGRAWPALTPLVVRHGSAGAEVLLTTPTAKCLPVEHLDQGQMCDEERTEWVEVPVPVSGDGIGEWLCGPGLGSCDEGQDPPGVVVLKLEFYDGESNGIFPHDGLVLVGGLPKAPEGFPIFTDPGPGTEGPLGLDLELRHGHGCQVQCIVQGHAYPRGYDAFLVVITDTPARIRITVFSTDTPASYTRALDSYPQLQKGFGGWFEDLEPATTYNVHVYASDAEGNLSEATGSFTTLSHHVEILFYPTVVQDHPWDEQLTAVYFAHDWQTHLATHWNRNGGRPPGEKRVSLENPPGRFPLAVEVQNLRPPLLRPHACSDTLAVGQPLPLDEPGALPGDYGPTHGATPCYAFAQVMEVITVDTQPAWAPSPFEWVFHGRLDTGTGPDVVHFTFFTVTVTYR